jgi:hypothetical protein
MVWSEPTVSAGCSTSTASPPDLALNSPPACPSVPAGSPSTSPAGRGSVVNGIVNCPGPRIFGLQTAKSRPCTLQDRDRRGVERVGAVLGTRDLDLWVRTTCRRPRLGRVPVGDEPFNPPDRHCALEAGAGARRLTGRVAGAPEGADQRRGLEDQFEGFVVLATAHERHVPVRLDARRAVERARRGAGQPLRCTGLPVCSRSPPTSLIQHSAVGGPVRPGGTRTNLTRISTGPFLGAQQRSRFSRLSFFGLSDLALM